MLAAGCSSPGTESATGVETPTTGPNATLRKIDHPVLENLLAVSGRMYSGGEPHGDEAFAALARLGIKTVVSVDGQKPDIAAARAQGLRYVHIPIGYDGVDDDAGRTLARLVRDADGPFCWRRSGCAADCRYRRASR